MPPCRTRKTRCRWRPWRGSTQLLRREHCSAVTPTLAGFSPRRRSFPWCGGELGSFFSGRSFGTAFVYLFSSWAKVSFCFVKLPRTFDSLTFLVPSSGRLGLKVLGQLFAWPVWPVVPELKADSSFERNFLAPWALKLWQWSSVTPFHQDTSPSSLP